MSSFRKQKLVLQEALQKQDWADYVTSLCLSASSTKQAINALLGLLPRPEVHWQAAGGLGIAVCALAAFGMEEARIIMRRLMWSMNEESGNLGWGVPEAMGAIVGKHDALAAEYGNVLLSYMYDTGGEDNFLEYTPLRRGVYWAAGSLAQRRPLQVLPVATSLVQGFLGDDTECTAYAAWALTQLCHALPTPQQKAARQQLNALGVPQHCTTLQHNEITVTFLVGTTVEAHTVGALAQTLLGCLSA